MAMPPWVDIPPPRAYPASDGHVKLLPASPTTHIESKLFLLYPTMVFSDESHTESVADHRYPTSSSLPYATLDPTNPVYSSSLPA